jgi:hypothetical protein
LGTKLGQRLSLGSSKIFGPYEVGEKKEIKKLELGSFINRSKISNKKNSALFFCLPFGM